MFELFKSIHIIGFVSWFAALFYLPRLFIYHKEAIEKQDSNLDILSNQFKLMEKRLYHIIMTPAMIITLFCGIAMLYLRGYDWFKFNIWMHWKLSFLFMLIFYHFHCKKIMLKLANNQLSMSAYQLRFYNEIATILLVIIVLLAVFKNSLNTLYAFSSIILLVILLMSGIKVYKKIRQAADK